MTPHFTAGKQRLKDRRLHVVELDWTHADGASTPPRHSALPLCPAGGQEGGKAGLIFGRDNLTPAATHGSGNFPSGLSWLQSLLSRIGRKRVSDEYVVTDETHF